MNGLRKFKDNRKVNKYSSIHYWLRTRFGKADKCESENCKNKSKSYHYALKKGSKHDFNRKNYITLCQSCHKIYDMTDEISKKISKSQLGEKHNLAKLNNNIVFEIRNNYDGSSKYIKDTAKKYGLALSTIRRCLNRKTWKHI